MKTYYKVECMIANRTNAIKLILWEDTIDKVSAGKSYLLQNVDVRSFDDTRFVNTKKTTVVQEVDENYRCQYKYTRSPREPPHRTMCRDRHKEEHVMPCLQSLPSRRPCKTRQHWHQSQSLTSYKVKTFCTTTLPCDFHNKFQDSFKQKKKITTRGQSL